MLKLLRFLCKIAFKPLFKLFKSQKELSLKYFCLYSFEFKKSSLKPSTIENKKYLHKMLFEILKDIKIKEFTKLKAYELIKTLQEKSLKYSTIKQLISYANEGINLALELGIITQNPLKNIKFLKPTKAIKPNKTIKQLHIKKLLNKAEGELKTFLYFAFYTGARASEILAITKKDINYKQNLISITKNATRYGITTPKNGKSRIIPLSNALKKELENINFSHFSLDYFAIYYQFNKLKKSLNLKIGSLHSTRHTFASNCIHLKLDLPIIAKHLGHNDITMLSRVYSHEIYSKSEYAKLKNLSYFK
ncbi:site-specific integrase [Campylobacter sp. RM12642]|uniref:tyrosine-type recombinase/integrase n=1 Tax=Campylobacter sp. RM12642 TaxID=2735736 RepID=UPI003014DA28|nr:site-specific integrase [Campylobacter sp. RM12642]